MSSGGFKEGLPPIPNDIARIAGPPYLGILLNWSLFGVLTLQYYLYYLNFRKDHLFLKYAVHFIFIVEMVQTFFTVADGFHWFVFGFGDVDKLDEFFLANFDTPIMSSVIALVVQGVYAWRVYRLSKLKFITGIIILCSVAQAVGGLGIGIVNQQVGTIKKWQPHFTVLAIFWASFSAAADVLIASTMTWLLLKSRAWKSGDERNNVVTKIVRLTIETNVASAAVALCVLLTTVIPGVGPPKGTYFLAPSYVLGKLYSNSFMAMLNNRTILQRDMSQNEVIVSNDSSRQGWVAGNGGQPARVALPTPSFVAEGNESTDNFAMDNMKSRVSSSSRV